MWFLCPHTCQFHCLCSFFLFVCFFSLQRFIWGHFPIAQSSDLMPDPLQLSGLMPVASPARGLKTGSHLLAYSSPQSSPLSFVIQLLLAVLSLPCPGQHLSLLFLMTRWFWILAAWQGGIKNREVNCGLGRVQSTQALQSPMLLKAWEIVVRELSVGNGSTACFSERERERGESPLVLKDQLAWGV